MAESTRTPENMPQEGCRRVYVGNLAWRVKWQDLKDHMRTVGEVKFVEIIGAQNGRSKGCGIVEYVDAESAARAQVELNDSTLLDRKIFVREDREANNPDGFRPRRNRPESVPRYESRAPRAALNEETMGRQLYVGNLAWKVNWRDLKDLFGGPDLVERADVATDQDGRSRGFGFVIMKTKEAAEDAILHLNEKEHEGRTLLVKIDNGPPGARGGRD